MFISISNPRKDIENMTHDMMLNEDWQQVADYIIKKI